MARIEWWQRALTRFDNEVRCRGLLHSLGCLSHVPRRWQHFRGILFEQKEQLAECGLGERLRHQAEGMYVRVCQR